MPMTRRKPQSFSTRPARSPAPTACASACGFPSIPGGRNTLPSPRPSSAIGKSIGVKAVLEGAERPVVLKRVYADYDFDATLQNYTTSGDPALGISRIYTTELINKAATFNNASGYSNPEVDALFAKGRDRRARKSVPRTTSRRRRSWRATCRRSPFTNRPRSTPRAPSSQRPLARRKLLCGGTDVWLEP